MAQDDRKALGSRGEDAALKYLTEQGMQMLDRNLRSRTGEVDLVLQDGDTLVFCEVKTRRGNGGALAVSSYSKRQIHRLQKQIGVYLMKNSWEGPLRVDLLALQKVRGKETYRIEHLKNAVQFDGAW